jgi:hypothetical protein
VLFSPRFLVQIVKTAASVNGSLEVSDHNHYLLFA